MPTIDQARGWHAALDPVHGFDHVLRVLDMALRLGRQVGADLEILHAAALLHDASGAAPSAAPRAAQHGAEPNGGGRESHEHASAEFARRVLTDEGWPEERIAAVEHCIRAHRYRGSELARSLEAQVLFDADKLDVLGAFGVARTLGYALQAGQPFFAEPSAHFLQTGEAEPDEPHSAYHEYLFKLRRVIDRLHTAPARALAERRYALLTAFFEQLAGEARGSA